MIRSHSKHCVNTLYGTGGLAEVCFFTPRLLTLAVDMAVMRGITRTHMVCQYLLARPPIKWAPTFQKAIQQEERKKERDVRKQKVYRSYEYSSLESFKKMNNSGLLRLESLERAFRYLFANSKLELGFMQERLKREFTIAHLKQMFKNDLIPNLKFLQEKFNITEMYDTLSVLFPSKPLFIIISVVAYSFFVNICRTKRYVSLIYHFDWSSTHLKVNQLDVL